MAQQVDNNNDEDQKKKNKFKCMGCAKKLKSDHAGIICLGDHHTCSDCSKSIVNQVFEFPDQHIPIKCMLCKTEVIPETFERQLDHKQSAALFIYNMQYNPKFILADDEIVVSCPFCQYFEINTADAGRLLFLCKKAGCKQSSCFWCKKKIKNTAAETQNDDQNEENEEDENDTKKKDFFMWGKDDEKVDENDVESHFICAQLGPYKQIWDKALSEGMARPCPQCGISGMKDGACTHIDCVKCKTRWCYVCGLSEAKCDKKPVDGEDKMMGHHWEWKTNQKRCPLYLDQIREIDERWPKDDPDGCVMFLHRLRGMELLKKAIQEIGDEKYKELCKVYGVEETCGFDMKEVLEGDHRLIIRKLNFECLFN